MPLFNLNSSDRELDILIKLITYGSDELEHRPALRELTGISLKDLAQVKRTVRNLKSTLIK